MYVLHLPFLKEMLMARSTARFNKFQEIYSVFVFNNGFGMVKQDRLFVYDNVSRAIIQKEGDITPDDVNEGKAYVQTLYWDYNSR